jgi:hypothetical protein
VTPIAILQKKHRGAGDQAPSYLPGDQTKGSSFNFNFARNDMQAAPCKEEYLVWACERFVQDFVGPDLGTQFVRIKTMRH